MRYLSLRFLGLLYRLFGVLGALFTVVAFIAVLSIDPHTIIGQLVALAVLFIGGLSSISSYAAGEFISLMIDIESGVRNIDLHFNHVDYPEDRDPVQPPRRPLADFPPSRYSKPPGKPGGLPPGTYDERLRR